MNRTRFAALFAYVVVAGCAESLSGSTSEPLPRDPPPVVRRLSVGATHTCAIRGEGTLRCWGFNGNHGMLGHGTQSSREPPLEVVGLRNAIDVAAAENHTCALTTDHSVWCWGFNHAGELGVPVASSEPEVAAPQRVPLLGDAVQVCAGSTHSCALLADRTVRCWGAFATGLSSNAGIPHSEQPVSPEGLRDVAEVRCGYSHSCARLIDGTVRCWGNGRQGQLGDGRSVSSGEVVRVTGLDRVVSIELGGLFSCALRQDGAVMCWGLTPTDSASAPRFEMVPRRVASSTAVVQLAAGLGHLCLRDASGTVRCEGDNHDGQLGVPAPASASTLDPAVVGSVVELSGGLSTTCALRTDSSVMCWGANGLGQVGDGCADEFCLPTRVAGL